MIAIAAALQAVDGIALKATVDRWAAANGDARALAFEAAIAVRQVEVGLASFLSIVSGLTLTIFGLAVATDGRRTPAWLAAIALIGGLGTVAAGVTMAFTGFSAGAMTLSLLASFVLMVWALLIGFHNRCKPVPSLLTILVQRDGLLELGAGCCLIACLERHALLN